LEDQNKDDYDFCTIVQQCSDPYSMLSLGEMTGQQRGLVYTAFSTILSSEYISLLQLQQQSNMMLGEMQMQVSATTSSCDDGTCRLLRDPDGLLPYNYNLNTTIIEDFSTYFGAISSDDCYDLYKNGTQTFWYCNNDEEPRSMMPIGQMNVETGQYYMGNSWEQPHVQDYFSVYGNLDSEDGSDGDDGDGFGVRFSSHHIDINYQWDKDGMMVQAAPVFINPTFECMDEPPHKNDDDEDDHHDPDDTNNSTRLRG
jgi:hypothetical protein